MGVLWQCATLLVEMDLWPVNCQFSSQEEHFLTCSICRLINSVA
uniref:Uncharacterized protein n=1 Tax=Anguilla anguilla TaxID=7936 RepID=A0A0E9V4K2_ANGAN